MYHDKRRCPIATQQSAWHPSRCLATDHARRQCRAHPPVLLRVDTVPSSFLSNSSISWLFPGLRLKKACILSLKAIQEFYHLIAGSTRIWVKEQDCSQKTWYERRKKSKEVMRDQQIGQKHLLLGHAPWVVACLRTVITMPCRSLRCASHQLSRQVVSACLPCQQRKEPLLCQQKQTRLSFVVLLRRYGIRGTIPHRLGLTFCLCLPLSINIVVFKQRMNMIFDLVVFEQLQCPLRNSLPSCVEYLDNRLTFV